MQAFQITTELLKKF